MDSEKESSIRMPLPPPPPPPLNAARPPPPPPPPMMNASPVQDTRSQLLADIRKGATLKKAPTLNDANQNELSPSDKLKKQTQDLLQAELTSTLKRRKPVVINEPPKYDYPTYDDSNKNNESSHSSSANNINNGYGINGTSTITPIVQQKPLNVNAVLSVVTGIKLPDIQYDANISASKPPAINDKVKITHGKPNFTVSQKENRPIVSPASPNVQHNSPEMVQTKYRRPSYGTSKSMIDNKVDATDTKPINANSVNGKPINNVKPIDAKATSNGKWIDIKPADTKSVDVKISDFKSTSMVKSADVKVTPLKSYDIMPETSAESQVKKCKSIFLLKSQNSIENDNSKPKKMPTKTESVSKFESIPISNVTVTSMNQKPELKKQTSVEETTSNGISFVSVANKKALFEKPTQSDTMPRTLKTVQPSTKPTTLEISNGKFSKLNGHRIISPSGNQANRSNGSHSSNGINGGVTTVSLNKNVSYGSMNRAPTKDRVDHFQRTVHTVNETTTTNKLGQLETRQFEQKTFVSFSKDLLNAPNNYPDQIRVKKTVVSERSNIATAPVDKSFQNIRFSIQTNGQVIPKAK